MFYLNGAAALADGSKTNETIGPALVHLQGGSGRSGWKRRTIGDALSDLVGRVAEEDGRLQLSVAIERYREGGVMSEVGCL